MWDFYKGKTVLVTGHTGFKGSWLCEILLEAGANVIGYSLEPSTKPSLFEMANLEKRMTSVIGDIRDYDHLNGVIKRYKPEIVFHLAAQPIVLIGYDKPAYTYNVNVMGTVNILEAIRKVGCVKSFVNITTDKVYLNDDVPDHPFKEDEPLDGFDPYSNSKSCSELVTHSYKKSFFKDTETAISTARAGNVIGGGDYSPNRIIPDCIRAVEAGQKIEIRNRHSTRPYQFVLEPLFVYMLIAEKQYQDKKYEGYYNVGPDKVDAVTTGDLVNLFIQKWGTGAEYEDRTIPNAPHEAGYLALDNSLVKKTFGWKPVYHVDEAIEQTVKFAKEGDNAKSDVVIAVMKGQIESFAAKFLKK
jgi:CDP-glucose 4,6-dehydratase